jgi:hypothetical protein
MEVGAPNSDPGSRSQAGSAGSREMKLGSGVLWNGYMALGLCGVSLQARVGRLSDAARESRGSRPGLT